MKLKFFPQIMIAIFVQVVAAEGEQKASYALRDAADILSTAPMALQLRYMQTLANNAAERESTIIFPIPMYMFELFTKND
jgi:erythrocyte band 7 integral membrane protein